MKDTIIGILYFLGMILIIMLVLNAASCLQYWHTNIADQPARCALTR